MENRSNSVLPTSGYKLRLGLINGKFSHIYGLDNIMHKFEFEFSFNSSCNFYELKGATIRIKQVKIKWIALQWTSDCEPKVRIHAYDKMPIVINTFLCLFTPLHPENPSPSSLHIYFQCSLDLSFFYSNLWIPVFPISSLTKSDFTLSTNILNKPYNK